MQLTKQTNTSVYSEAMLWIVLFTGEPLTTADVTTADVTTANATTVDSTANVTTADVLVLGYGLWVRV